MLKLRRQVGQPQALHRTRATRPLPSRDPSANNAVNVLVEWALEKYEDK